MRKEYDLSGGVRGKYAGQKFKIVLNGNDDSDTLLDRITVDPNVCKGEPCIRGTRTPVTIIIDSLNAGTPPQEIIADYPQLEIDDIRAAVVFAACDSHSLTPPD
jgi:uncharacterized protein (DUF433 family)